MDAVLQSSGEITGDANGVSEIYGLPNGNYTLESADKQQRWDFIIGAETTDVELHL